MWLNEFILGKMLVTHGPLSDSEDPNPSIYKHLKHFSEPGIIIVISPFVEIRVNYGWAEINS